MCTATPPRGTRMWVPAKRPFLPSGTAGPSCTHVARRQLVAAHRRVGVERAGAAFDVDPAVAARRAGVARDRVELFLALVQVRGERLQARRALLEVERQQRRHADAARVRSASAKSISSAWAWWIAAPSMALRERGAGARADPAVGDQALQDGRTWCASSGFVFPGAVLDLDHHAGALVEAEVVGRRHVEDAVRAVAPRAPSRARRAARRGTPACRAGPSSAPRRRRPPSAGRRPRRGRRRSRPSPCRRPPRTW